jgi:hypothetical protein
MKKNYFYLLPVLALMVCTGLQAQVTIGGATEPTPGVILDLNSPGGARGGLVLSSIAIEDLGKIPANVLRGISSEQDENPDLRGMMVYNTGTANVPRGIYVWNGYCWSPDGNCNPIITTPHTRAFTVHSANHAKLEITAEGCPPLKYTWHKNTVASTTGGTEIDDTDASIFQTPTVLAGETYYYYCTVKSSSGNVVVTSDLFTVTTVDCPGYIITNGVYSGPTTSTLGNNNGITMSQLTGTYGFAAVSGSSLCLAASDLSSYGTWGNAKTRCGSLGTGWRLPNIAELGNLQSSRTSYGMGQYYWSSTERNSSTAWRWNYVYEATYYLETNLSTYIRCVRSL